nr:hypothetical protein [Tanacetum cinerariifolium]
MLAQPQVHDVTEVEEDEDNNEVPAAPSPPSPAHESSPPPQEHIPPSSPPQQQPTQTVDTSEYLMTLLNTLMETCATLTQKVANLEQDKVAQALEIFKLKKRVKKLEKKRRSKSSGLKRGIAELDADKDVTLVDVDTAVRMNADTQGMMEDDVTAVKEVNAAEPTVFDDEEVTMCRKFIFSKYIFDNMVGNVDRPSNFLMHPRVLQVMINALIDDVSSHNTKYTSPVLTQKVFVNMRRIGKGFSGVETPLFDTMLAQPQVHDVTEVEEDEDNNE